MSAHSKVAMPGGFGTNSDMRLFLSWILGLCLTGGMAAAERVFDFSQFAINSQPKEFESTVTGLGKPGEWKVVLVEGPASSQLSVTNAVISNKRAVLAQLASDPTDEHFPLLLLGKEVYGDFVLSTRFQTVSGTKERMAGLAFRVQDPNNYYVVRASSLGNNLRFYKFVNGTRSQPIGPEIPIPSGTWHELSVECQGNTIRCKLNGKEAIPLITDYSFTSGRIGLWTKSDSISHFTDTRIRFTPRETLAQILVRESMQKNPRLLGLKVFAYRGDPPKLELVASDQPQEVGEAGTSVERDVIGRDVTYTGRTKNTVSATLPLHDRNGEVVAAVRVVMKPFPGQTEQNTIARAMPIVRGMEPSIRSAKDFVEP
ncbi:MAG TPA: hypothetical protein P5186_03460 [Candidatus Paceibacterota bacterium]|nr:hypothetical protein [Verrucomicrobiota bacterium]HRY47083.1 hypothetical protein [Candidatus Paceibacterota bacterium]HSA03420.1 hypothetical protein [Candidatus Paceibacterota bacterium]